MSLERPNITNDEEENLKKKVAIVDITGALEEQARDIADKKMTESKENLAGFKGFISKIWKHNLFNEYYRQVEIAKARQNIEESGNLYVDEEAGQAISNRALNAVTSRFLDEYEESIHEDAGENKRILEDNDENIQVTMGVRALIREYTAGRLTEEAFLSEKNRVIARAHNVEDDRIQTNVTHTDNLFEIAQQVKSAVENGACIEELEKEIEITLGKARLGVRTEARYNTVDKLIDKVRSTKLGRLVNETTVALGVSAAYSVSVGLSQRLARSKVLAWGTFGASALLGGVIAGARESVKITDERKQHSREMAKGETFNLQDKRRSEMEGVRYETLSCQSIASQLELLIGNLNTQEDIENIAQVLADAESRIKISDRDNVDLLSYTNIDLLEEERMKLDRTRAQAKVALKKRLEQGDISVPFGTDFNGYYDTLLNLHQRQLIEGDEGIETKDQLFAKMKKRKVAGAVVKGVITGLVVGGVAQEVHSLVSDNQAGIVEGVLNKNHSAAHVTALEGVRRMFTDEYLPHPGNMKTFLLPDNNSVQFPDNVEIIQNPNIPNSYIVYRDGELISESVTFDKGALSADSTKLLENNGIHVHQTHSQLFDKASNSKFITEVKEVEHTEIMETEHTPQEYIDNHKEDFTKIHRDFWYDNNTERFDKNELRLQWGGKDGTGIDKNGNYTFNVSHMKPGDSYHGSEHVNPQQALKEGKLSMLLSLSRDTQFECVRVPIDAQGNAIIDPNSTIAKTFFKVVNGQLVYKGRYAEVGFELGIAKDGIPRFGILATDEGEGLSSIVDTENIVTKTTEYVQRELPDSIVNHLDITDDYDVDPPPFVPVFGRTPLEKTEKGKSPFADYGYFGKTRINREDWTDNFSDSLKDNPDVALDEKKEITRYLEKQTKEHKKVIEELSAEAGPMNPKCRLSVCIPAAGSQEGKNIYSTLENFLNQTASKEDFEIVVFVNKPDVDKEGNEVKPDETYDEVVRFMAEHPEVQVRVCHKTLPKSEALIGNIRKILNDTVVYRRNQLKDGDRVKKHFILSNDADNKGVSSEYIQNFINKFDTNEDTDAFMGQLDWDIESYARNPMVHIGTRLMQFMEVQERNESIASSGANFAFRTESYAAVGGYDSTCQKCEDVILGRALKAARLGSTQRQAIKFAGAVVSRIFTSSRRAEKAVKDGFSPYEQWRGEFGAFDDEVRKTDWASISEGINFEDVESVKKLVKGIENVINRTAAAMLVSTSDHKSFRKAMGWLGIKYKVVSGNKIEIVNTDRFIQGLIKYQGDYKAILEKKLKKEVI